MIRHRRGSDFLLFTQHDHALLSGQIAERIGSSFLSSPSPQTLQAISLHDSGWPLHDDAPTLNEKGEPLHVFETPPQIATKMWSESVRHAAAVDPYSGLLVSLHVLHLSLMSQAAHKAIHDVFNLNRFQHAQIEIQEKLRPRVGLRIDRPLTHGLALPGESPQEDALRSNLQLLRLMDSASLMLLCLPEMALVIEALPTPDHGAATQVRAERTREFSITVTPWLLNVPSVELPVPFRRVPAQCYSDKAEFLQIYKRGPTESVTVRVTPDPRLAPVPHVAISI